MYKGVRYYLPCGNTSIDTLKTICTIMNKVGDISITLDIGDQIFSFEFFDELEEKINENSNEIINSIEIKIQNNSEFDFSVSIYREQISSCLQDTIYYRLNEENHETELIMKGLFYEVCDILKKRYSPVSLFIRKKFFSFQLFMIILIMGICGSLIIEICSLFFPIESIRYSSNILKLVVFTIVMIIAIALSVILMKITKQLFPVSICNTDINKFSKIFHSETFKKFVIGLTIALISGFVGHLYK